MKAWLREQAERKAAEIVTYKSDTLNPPQIYCTTWRYTGSDVLSIVTTTKVLIEQDLLEDSMDSPKTNRSPIRSPSKKQASINVSNPWSLREDEAKEKIIDPQRKLQGKKINNEENPSFKQPLYISPLNNNDPSKESEKLKRNEALWEEEKKFMSRLGTRRAARVEVENKAAIKIQSCVRGWIFRKGIRDIRKKLKAKRR